MNPLLVVLVVVGGFMLTGTNSAAEGVNGQTIHLNSQVVDASSLNTVAAVSRTGAVSNLFAEQKAMVRQVLNELGIAPETLPPQVRQRLETPHTQNINAFVAYSMGIDYMDQGRYVEARAAFSRSASLDPSFQQAVQMERTTPLTRESLQRMVERTVRSASQRGSELLTQRPTQPAAAAPAAPATPGGTLRQAMSQTVQEVQNVAVGMASLVSNIQRDPNSAPEQFKLATSRGVAPGMALETALVSLDRPQSALVDRVLGEAIKAGVSVDDVRQVARQIRARGGCQ